VDGADDLRAVDALQIDARDPEVGVLALNHHERYALMSHLDRVRMPKLMWREPPSDACSRGGVVELLSGGGCFPTPAGGWAVEHAQKRADRELLAGLDPRVELIPCPTVHPYLATLAALPASDENCSASSVQIAFLNRERFADLEPSAPEAARSGQGVGRLRHGHRPIA
jgi:hypothetical protein